MHESHKDLHLFLGSGSKLELGSFGKMCGAGRGDDPRTHDAQKRATGINWEHVDGNISMHVL